MTVADLMCETPICVRPECTTDKALDLFFEYETTELYVTDKSGRLLGVLPDYELLKTELSGEARGTCVEQLMSRNVPVFKADADAAEAARLFRDNRFSRFPVVKAGRLVGIVTRADVMRIMAVLRRIDAPTAKTKIGPKRPKMLSSTKAVRTTRSKPVSGTSKITRSRSKIASRPRTSSVR